jgi:hypothetical protein
MRRVIFLVLVAACGSTPVAPPVDGGPEVQPVVGPTVLLSDFGLYPYGIAVDDTYVYFTSSVSGTLARFPKNGGDSQILVSNMANPGRLAVDANNVYVVVRGTADAYIDGAILAVAKDGTATTTLASSLHGADGIALDGDELYVACNGATLNGSYAGDGSIGRVKTDGSSAIEVLLTPEAFASGVVVDDTNVYFTDRYSGTVSRCAKQAEGGSYESTRSDLFTGLDEPVGIALAGTTLVFAEYHGGRVLTGGIDGSAFQVLQPSRGLPHDVAYAGNAYWLESLTLEINRQPLDPTARFVTLAKTTSGPSVLAMDDVYVYVTDEHAGTITRAPR